MWLWIDAKPSSFQRLLCFFVKSHDGHRAHLKGWSILRAPGIEHACPPPTPESMPWGQQGPWPGIICDKASLVSKTFKLSISLIQNYLTLLGLFSYLRKRQFWSRLKGFWVILVLFQSWTVTLGVCPVPMGPLSPAAADAYPLPGSVAPFCSPPPTAV